MTIRLGNIQPAIPAEPASVWATLVDGCTSFAMAVVGWEIPAPHQNDGDEWLVVHMRASASGRDWEARFSPFAAGALTSLSEWCWRLAEGRTVPNLNYDDPEFEFSGTASDGDMRHVAITLRQFAVPEDLDDPDDGYRLDMNVSRDELLAFGYAVGAQAHEFMPGTHRSGAPNKHIDTDKPAV